MRTVRRLPGVEPRCETGTVQFGDDWPGVFIRGDNAAHFAMVLRGLLETAPNDDPILMMSIRGYLETLEHSNVVNHQG